MYVEDIKYGVCSFCTTLYTEYRYHVEGVEDTLDRVASCPSKGKAI